MNDTGFVYVKYPLDTSITSYSLAYTIEDKPLLGDTKTTSATIIITVTPASVPPGWLFTCLFVCSFLCLLVCLLGYLFVYFSVCLLVCLL